MKVKLKDIGLDLESETKEESEILNRFYKGGIHVLGIDSVELTTLRLSFRDMIEANKIKTKPMTKVSCPLLDGFEISTQNCGRCVYCRGIDEDYVSCNAIKR